MIKNYKNYLAIGIAALMFATGCSKDEEEILAGKTEQEKEDIAMEMAQEQQDAYEGFANGMAYADQGLEEAEGGRMNQDCYTVTYNESLTEVKYSIDFGDGCVDSLGRTIRGAIEVTVGFEMTENSISMTSTYNFLNYQIDGDTYSGKVIVDGLGFSFDENQDKLEYHFILKDAKHTYADGSSTVINRDWTMTMDYANPTIVTITGKGSGKTRLGLTFSSEITTPFVIDSACGESGFATKGYWEANVSELGKITVDYGDGTCDNEVVLTYNDKSFTVSVDN